MKTTGLLIFLAMGLISLTACGSNADGDGTDNTDTVLSERSADCADHAGTSYALVQDIQRALGFESDVSIETQDSVCVLVSNNIPNHDFNDESASFANDVAEVGQSFEISRTPALAAEPTPLKQQTYDAVLLNGVPVDLPSAGCYRPEDPKADVNGDVAVGCSVDSAWLLDPMGSDGFGQDAHNAHTQPDGSYHYHGNPMALFDENPGDNGSPVIGFAADGFPIYGSYFVDAEGTLRKAESGYALKSGSRPEGDGDPGGTYTGRYVQDFEFTGEGDLDACNGMSVDGQYGYYVTDSYPWILGCLSGTPDPSFEKGAPQ